MKLNREEVERIALLARLGISKDEVETFRVQLSNILENFEILNQVDTTNLPPTSQSINLQNIFRLDETKASYKRQDILSNSPQQENNFFKVKAVLEE